MESKINYLEEYSRIYNTVEIDQWFWSLGKSGVKLPNPKTVEEYKNSIPKEFKFSIKLPNNITLTHFYKRNKKDPLEENPYFLSNELMKEFLKTIDPLKPNLGPLMFQFEYLNKQKMPSQQHFQALFQNFIQKRSDNFIYAVETRNPNYLNRAYFEFLKENNLSHVFLQGYYMPPVFEVFDKFKHYLLSPVIIRLHGPDRTNIEKLTNEIWDRIVLPKDSELDKLAIMINEILNMDIDVYVNVNNHYEGSAPITIDRIQERFKNLV